jgi:hypothetical protein
MTAIIVLILLASLLTANRRRPAASQFHIEKVIINIYTQSGGGDGDQRESWRPLYPQQRVNGRN